MDTTTPSGELLHRIQIVRATITGTNELGEATTSTSSTARWANIRPLSARELANAATMGEQVTHQIIIRYTPNISSQDNITFNGRHFAIKSIRNIDERKIDQVILATEVA